MAWKDKRDGDGPNYNIYFSKSTDGGATFGQDVRVDDAGDDASRQEQPAIAVDESGRIYVVWLDERGNGDREVRFSRSIDGGASFDSSIVLPNGEDDPGWYGDQFGPSVVAVGDGRVCVSYVDYRHEPYDGPNVVCVRHSVDAGVSFSDPVDVASDLRLSTQRTSLAMVGSLDVYVAWMELEDYPFVATSGDGGATFGPGVQVTDKASVWSLNDAPISLVANSSGWLAVAWRDSFGTLAFSESRDGGASFLSPVLLQGPGERNYATVAFDADQAAYVAWTDYRHSAHGDVYLAKGILDPAAGAQDPGLDAAPVGMFLQLGPSPFRSEALITFEVPSASKTKVAVYSVSGRLVDTLVNQSVEAGSHSVVWDGDSAGPGVYFVEFTCESGRVVKRLVLLD